MRIVKNWNKLFPRNEQGQTVINSENLAIMGQCIAYFMAKPHGFEVDGVESNKDLQNFRKTKKAIYGLQNLSTATDFPEFLNDLRKKFQTLPIFDEGYRAIFDIRDLSGTDGWDVYTETDSITFVKIKPGGKIEYHGHSGAKYRVYVDYYGGGYGVDRRLIDTRNFYEIEKGLVALRNRAYIKTAAVFYALIEAIGSGQNIAWQAPDPSTLPNTADTYTANRDAQTIALAVRTLIANNKSKGYMSAGLNTAFFLLYPYQIDIRIRMALKLTLLSTIGEKYINFILVPIQTTMLAAADKYYVGIAKNKLEGGELLALTQFNEFNQDNYTEKIAHWKAFGANIGDEEQIQRCAIA